MRCVSCGLHQQSLHIFKYRRERGDYEYASLCYECAHLAVSHTPELKARVMVAGAGPSMKVDSRLAEDIIHEAVSSNSFTIVPEEATWI